MIKGLAKSALYIGFLIGFSIGISYVFNHLEHVRELADWAILIAFIAFLVIIVKIGGDSIDK